MAPRVDLPELLETDAVGLRIRAAAKVDSLEQPLGERTVAAFREQRLPGDQLDARLMVGGGVAVASDSHVSGGDPAHGAMIVVEHVGGGEFRQLPALAIDARVLLFAAMLAVGTALLFGLVPAMHAARAGISARLHATPRMATPAGRRVKQGLVVAELALATVLLIIAGLLLRSLVALLDVERLEHLRASHIQPWRDSDNDARLDGENGLLLTPTIDHLFDRGFISFEDTGRLIVSPVADRISLRKMGVETETGVNVGPFSSGQRAFLQFHRNAVLLQAQRRATR